MHNQESSKNPGQQLRPRFESDGKGNARRWTVEEVIARLAEIHSNRVAMNGVTFEHLTECDTNQQKIISLLKQNKAMG